MSEQTLIALLFAAGALARVVLPYLQVWVTSREPFDWRKVVGQILGAAVIIIPTLTGLVDQLAQASPAAAVVIGWGAADIGRQGQKVYDQLRGVQS